MNSGGIKCYHCKKERHIRRFFPERRKDDDMEKIDTINTVVVAQ